MLSREGERFVQRRAFSAASLERQDRGMPPALLLRVNWVRSALAGGGATHFLKLQFKFYPRGVVFIRRAESIALQSQSRSTARTRAAQKSQPALRNG